MENSDSDITYSDDSNEERDLEFIKGQGKKKARTFSLPDQNISNQKQNVSYYLPVKDLLLHSKNVVIHENNAKITDFGISKNQCNQTSTDYIEYKELYKNCWNQEPEQRPTINKVLGEWDLGLMIQMN
ncbi:unnamed protein product [Rhizophagus irregularis]|nr:unnamed protein product [Rhizophagus irregularis]